MRTRSIKLYYWYDIYTYFKLIVSNIQQQFYESILSLQSYFPHFAKQYNAWLHKNMALDQLDIYHMNV